MPLTLVTAINDGGHPVLPREDERDSEPEKGDDLLSAVTAIIVRNHEIVAAFAHGSNHIILQENVEGQEDVKVIAISGITTFINPLKDRKKRNKNPPLPESCLPVLADAGSSHLEDILRGDFKFLLIK
jgi:hypothetical protein